MATLTFLVFEPFRLSPVLWPVQLAIRMRTGRPTHVGMLWSENVDWDNILPCSLAKFRDQDIRLISATWPRVRVQNLANYKGDRVYVRDLEVDDDTATRVRNWWASALAKGKSYSVSGLIWFVVGTWVGAITGKDEDIDPRGAFCSEAATNSLYTNGVRVFSFIGDQFEDALLRARRTATYTDWLHSLTPQEKACMAARGLPPHKVWQLRYKKWIYGYKVSPRDFLMSPIFTNRCIIRIDKEVRYDGN